MKRTFTFLSPPILALLAVLAWLGFATLQAGAPAARAATADGLYPPGASLVPLGAAQSELRHAYNAIFDKIYDGGAPPHAAAADPIAWSAAPSALSGEDYAAGTIVALNGLSGDFDSVATGGGYTLARAHTLRPVRVAFFYSSLRDASDQVVAWEEASFETIFRVYLWGVNHHDYFDPLDEAAIRAGALDGYDVLILPSITIGYADEVSAALGAAGRDAIAAWVAAGGTLYAQGDAAYLAQDAGLLPAGTVLDERLSDLPPYDNLASLEIADALDALTFSWLSDQTYVLDDPVLAATEGVTVVATYAETTHPGTPAILYRRIADGEVVVTNAHPSVRQRTYPLVLDVIFLAMSERMGMDGRLQQLYSPLVAPDVIPAYEAGIPISVTTDVRDYWDEALGDVTITETVSAGFVVDAASVVPTPTALIAGPAGTQIVWFSEAVSPGVTSLSYVAHTLTGTLAGGSAIVSVAEASYTDPFTGRVRRAPRNPLEIYASMAARLNGDRDIELDGLYPLPAGGYYFDIALTLENKEPTLARDVVITDVVALLSPIVDVDDQRLIPTVLTDTATMTSTGETIWAANEVFFYNNANYPLPQGVATNLDVINLSNWDGVTWYTYTNELDNTVTVPAGYEAYVQINADGSIRLPAAVLRWDYGDLPGYDALDPAVRYGIFSRELLGRQVSFASDPLLDGGVVLNGSGGSVFTNLGGDPIPYHEYLSSGIVTVPEAPVPVVVTYQDVWERPKALELRTVFYDIVPFPPPEYHAVVNTTFEMNVDWDGDGTFSDSVLEYPSNVPANLHLMLKSHSNFDPALPPLRKDETLISQGLFRGLGFELLPASGDWATSWSLRDLQGKGPDATVLTDVVETEAYTYLYFQQELDSQAYEVIDINGILDAGAAHTEGVLKINDGARFVYHQKAVGPSRYEVFDSHVQAVFGLRSDAEVNKRVAPVKVATYEDVVYHFIEVEDPWEPRQFTADPFIQSYGFGDMAATVYVGGRHQRELLYARVNPGEATQIRVEINNNTGISLTGVTLVPNAPAGVHVSLRSYTETTAIEPLFFDFPFLNTSVISDAWKGVYYFDVTVDDPFPAARGRVYTVTFALEGDNIPAGFRIPAAQIGVKDTSGHVYTVYGLNTNLALADRLPPWATLADARIANTDEMNAMIDAVNFDDAHPGSDTTLALYETLRGGITSTVVTGTNGSDVSFILPPYASILPWHDGDNDMAGTLYVILRSDMDIRQSGTVVADYAPEIEYLDFFNQVLTDTGNLETVEARGAVLTLTYTIRDVPDSDWQPGDPLPIGASNEVLIDADLANLGDDIAADTLITFTIPANTTPLRAEPAWESAAGGVITWRLGDLGPGATRLIRLSLELTPSLNDYGRIIPLIARSDARFLNVYAQRYVTTDLAGPLNVMAGGSLQVYFNDFEAGAGSEWSLPRLGETPGGRGFLGEFGSETTTLRLADLPRHGEVEVSFDLYVIRTWDGNQLEYEWPGSLLALQGIETPGEVVGPDVWALQADGASLLRTTFANWENLGFRQAYPGHYPAGSYPARTGAAENNSLGYVVNGIPMDSVYHLAYTFPHSAASLDVDFAALGLQALADEAWGLDNVRVTITMVGPNAAGPYVIYLPAVTR
ncbi:MAG: hypothetical protein ACOYYS_09430 [Chloroflexota bacterium]